MSVDETLAPEKPCEITGDGRGRIAHGVATGMIMGLMGHHDSRDHSQGGLMIDAVCRRMY